MSDSHWYERYHNEPILGPLSQSDVYAILHVLDTENYQHCVIGANLSRFLDANVPALDRVNASQFARFDQAREVHEREG